MRIAQRKTVAPTGNSSGAAGLAWFVVGRLAQAVLTLLATSFLVFTSVFLAPGSALAFLSAGRSLPPETLASIRERYHLDDPFLERYLRWLADALHGDFGVSLASNQDVSRLIGDRTGTTLLLLVMSACIILGVGVALGVVSAVRGGRWDGAVLLGSAVGLGVPSFVAAIVLIAVFSVQLEWLPVLGSGEGLLDRLYHLLLPSVALALASTAYMARVTRAAVRDQAEREFVEAAAARGLPRRAIVRRHILRNALIPVTTLAGLTIAGLIASTVLVEQAFSLDGLGSLLVNAVETKDFPVVQAVSLLLVATFVLINTVVDCLYPLLDPRIELTGTRRGPR